METGVGNNPRYFQMRCPECFSSITKVYNHECPRLYPIPKTEKEAQRFVWAHYQQRSAGIGFEIINEGSTDAFSDQEAKLHATRSASVGDWGKAWRDATGEFIRVDGRSDGWIKFNGNKRLRGLKSNGLGYTEYVVLYLE